MILFILSFMILFSILLYVFISMTENLNCYGQGLQTFHNIYIALFIVYVVVQFILFMIWTTHFDTKNSPGFELPTIWYQMHYIMPIVLGIISIITGRLLQIAYKEEN